MTESSGPAPARPPVHRRWLVELRRRRVFRVIAAYGAVSFVVLQAADVVVPAVPLPEWTNSLVLWLVVFGLPLAVVVAWAFELTPEGVRRTESARPEELAELLAELPGTRWRAGILAVAGVGLLAGGFLGGRTSAVGSEGVPASSLSSPGNETIGAGDDARRPAIAVLPFSDLSPGGDEAYFSAGVSEEILTVLSRIPDLKVAARMSAFTYQGAGADLRKVGQELNVPYLLAGSVRRAGDRVRIAVELVSASDGLRLWSETYERQLVDIFAIQADIAESIARSLRVPLGLPVSELALPTVQTDAHDLYLSARAALRSRGRGVGRAIELFEQALARDPDWAPAWAGLAEAHAIYPLYAGARGESQDSALWDVSLAEAETAARRALELDPGNPSARIALGGVYRDRWEWAEAETELLRAVEADPDNPEAHLQYAELLWGMGRLDEALRQTERALDLDKSPVMFDVHGFVQYMNGNPTEAEALLEEGLARDTVGNVHFLRTILANLLLFDGRYQTALTRFASYLPDSVAYRRIGEALERRDPSLLEDVQVTRGLAQAWTLLGERERALDVLEAAAFALPFRVQYEIWDPHLEPLWDTPRFQQILLPRLKLEGRKPSFAGPP